MVEREAFCVSVLAKQIEEGRMDSSPIWCGDLRELPTEELPRIDWIIGGYPCQPFSIAGSRLGEDDPRHLWPIIREQIDTLRPSGVFFENVSGHLTLGLRDVLRDLGERGFVCAFGLFTAEEVGAPHRRERVFILGMADTNGERVKGSRDELEKPEKERQRRKGASPHRFPQLQWPSQPFDNQRREEPPRTFEPKLGRDADELPDQLDRIRALGNAVVIPQAKKAAIMLMEELLNA
tara:strand:+ start:1758 stop:2465 length:708 start_codon:yes stop_codon:yes gene_type:complete